MNKFQSNVTKAVVWLTRFKMFSVLFSWIAKDKKNEHKFLVYFNIFNTSLYLTAAISPWIFIFWGLVVPTLLFRSSPLSATINVITMVRDKTMGVTAFMITIFFMMLFYICLFSCFYIAFADIGYGKDHLITGLWENFYFSVVTFTTLGYGNIVPINTAGEIIAAIEALVGFAAFAFLIGIASTVAINKETENKNIQDEIK